MFSRLTTWLPGNTLCRENAPVKAHIRYKDVFSIAGIIGMVTLLGLLIHYLGFSDVSVITLYILAVQIIAVRVSGRISNAVVSLLCVAIYNFFFTDPKYTLLAYDPDYPMTFVIMFIVSFLAGSLADRLKRMAGQSERNRYRTQILYDTSQLLNKALVSQEAAEVLGVQLHKLLDRDTVVACIDEEGKIACRYYPDTCRSTFEGQADQDALVWSVRSRAKSGAGTSVYPGARCSYAPLYQGSHTYGAVGVLPGDAGLDEFSESIMSAIISQCELAMENIRSVKDKEEAAMKAQNEKLRADLLRSISHDLRTPLTSISGNASMLMNSEQTFDEATRRQLYTDIYDDSIWLVNLVENLLAISRVQNGTMQLRTTTEVLDDVIDEALRHIDRHVQEHTLTVRKSPDIILAKMDVHLIVQVIINIVNNAVKYTPAGSKIIVSTSQKQNMACITIQDNGGGIPEEERPHLFEMFYNGSKEVADARKSMGLGLALCKSIVEAHGGSIFEKNVVPHGAAFVFTLPTEELPDGEQKV